MARRIPLAPIAGLPGVEAHPASGTPVPVKLRMFLEIWEPGDPPMKRTLGDLKRGFKWDAAAGTIRISHGDAGEFTIGPELIGGLPDTTPMRVNVMFGPGVGPDTQPPSTP